ncbi:MAG: hypothetical protein ABI760_01735 [Ferruginibacter sp.]
MKTHLPSPFNYSRSFILTIAAFLFLCGISKGQTVRYVTTTGLNTGTGTLANPYNTILKAIAAATTVNGDTIKVAAGTYTVIATTTVNKSVAILGTGATSSDVILDRGTYGVSAINGLTVTVSNVLIKNIKITRFDAGIVNTSSTVTNLKLDNVQLVENYSAGFFSGVSIDSLTIANSTLSYNGNKAGFTSISTSKRGIYLLNGVSYSKIKFDNNTVDYNGLAGIEISSISTTTSIDGITITNNMVRNNLDAQVSLWLGTANPLKKAISVSNNTIVLSDTARYGIEIRNPAGNGKASGAGSVVVTNNNISVVSHTGNSRDMAAIAVIRRKEGSALATMNDQPQGVVVSGNTISNFQNPRLGNAFGIVFGGIGHKVSGNTISNTEYSIQLQSGNTNFASNSSTPDVAGQVNNSYFDRDNSKYVCVEMGSNTIISSGAERLTTGIAVFSSTLPLKTTTNSTIGETFCTLQQAIDFQATLAGNTITATAGTYDEQVVIGKGVIIDGTDTTRIATFTGIATGALGIFTVNSKDVTIKNFKFIADLSKINSAIISSADASNLVINGNLFYSDKPVPAAFKGGYSTRNCIYITNSSSNITIQSNTINSLKGPLFRAGVAVDNSNGMLVGGNNLIDGNNFLSSVNHDVIIKNYNGAQTVKNNIFNGGGVEVANSSGDGAFIVSNNSFDGTYSHTIPTAMVRIFTNASSGRTINFSYNTFINQKWTVSFENTRNVVLDHNEITAAYDSFRLISVNTKLRQTTAPATLETIDIKLTNNNLNSAAGLTTGNALEFLNFDQLPANNYIKGNYVIGESGNENNFNANIPTFIKVSNLNGVYSLTQPFLDLYPEYVGIQDTSTTGYWKRDIFARYNKFYVNGALKLPTSFSADDLNKINARIFDRQDDINIGAVVLMPTWSGATGTDWADSTNWSYKFSPAAGLDAVIYPQINQPELFADAACDSIILSNNMTIKTGIHSLTVFGNVRSNGTMDATIGSITLAGTAPQVLSGLMVVKNLTLNNDSGAIIVAGTGNKVTLRGIYKPAKGVLTTNDNLVLKSDAAGTAGIDSGRGSYIIGKVTVERFIPAHRSWRFITSPVNVSGPQTIHDAWQEGVNNTTLNYSGNVNPASGYGTHITLGNAPDSGFDVGINNNPSIKGYNAITNKWVILPSTNIPISDYAAYMLFVRGDRSIDLSQGVNAPATNTILRSLGNIRMGDQHFNVAATGFTILGNPYASPIDLNQIGKSNSTNIQDNFYIWDPKITGSNGVGGVVNISWDGSVYDITPPPVSSISQYIQSGSSFYARTNDQATPGSLVVKETDKKNAGSDNVNRPQNVPGVVKMATNLYSVNSDGTTSIVDGVLNSFGDAYSNAVDNMDAVKLSNIAESFSTQRNGQQLVVERRQPVTIADTIYYRMIQMKVKDYNLEFKATGFENTGLNGFLEDNYLHTSRPVEPNGASIISFTISGESGSYAPDRFRMVFRPVSTLPVTIRTIKAWQQKDAVKVEWKVENELGIKQYEVEMSGGGTGFKWSATLIATGNSQGAYNWLDANAQEGNNYYRVKIVGVNGEIHYSSVVKVNIGKGKEQIKLKSGFITGGAITFRLINMPAGMYGLRLLNCLGQVICTKEVVHTTGNSIETLELNTRPAKGIYIIEFTSQDNKKITEKVFAE